MRADAPKGLAGAARHSKTDAHLPHTLTQCATAFDGSPSRTVCIPPEQVQYRSTSVPYRRPNAQVSLRRKHTRAHTYIGPPLWHEWLCPLRGILRSFASGRSRLQDSGQAGSLGYQCSSSPLWGETVPTGNLDHSLTTCKARHTRAARSCSCLRASLAAAASASSRGKGCVQPSPL